MNAPLHPRRRYNAYTFSFIVIILLALLSLVSSMRVRAHEKGADYSYSKSSGGYAKPAYDWRKGNYPPGAVRGEALDEAKAGMTLNGTPVTPRTDYCFPAEPRDVFWKMDQVAGPNGQLQPLNFDENGDGAVDDGERDAIRGRNTWLLWGGGNEAFWGWLQEKAYGITDFLILLDSRKRGSRFKDAGLINQPGFETNMQPILGLYFDAAKPDGSAILRPPQPKAPNAAPDADKASYSYSYEKPEPELYDAQGRKLAQPVYRPEPPPQHRTELFTPWTTAEARAKEWAEEKKPGEDPFKDYVPEVVSKKLPQDGLDPAIYGYPSGLFGLRLMLNPDFFGKTADAERARKYWKERVENTNGRYYTEAQLHMDPKLVRPFRVNMSCGFCHVAQHPLNPPKDNENPAWENLSSIIGAQYWDPQPAFGNVLKKRNFLHHFLRSQAPGSVDTSLVSTDQINNTNIINAIFDVPARLTRAMEKPTEEQSKENLLLKSIEDPETSNNPNGSNKRRHFPMVLFPGEDSVGVFGALARVPLNIGVFSEQWGRCDNPVIGFTPQRPFSIAVSRANSVYWNVNEKYRVGYMAKFFTLGASGKVAKSTAPMKLEHADANDEAGKPLGVGPNQKVRTLGQVELEKDTHEKRVAGRKAFLNNCAICHSSKQPPGFDLRFERTMTGGWDKAPVPGEPNRLVYTLPMDYRDWDKFKESPSYRDYLQWITKLAGEAPAADADDPFIKDNFLSNELRIPVTLVGTYPGRAMATNAMAGQVWDNYSSDTFKKLPSVGKIRFFNPYADPTVAALDPYGTNDEFDDGRTHGGPGYFRPASLISVWATAPYFHNNTLGLYNQDPSVKGRLVAFDDGIRKLLWPKQRSVYQPRDGVTYRHPGDLRGEGSAASKNDPGYIYRLPVDTYVMFQPDFTPLLIKSLLIGYVGIGPGNFLFAILSFWVWLLLAVIFIVLIFRGRARHAGIFVLLLALVVGALLAIIGVGGSGGILSRVVPWLIVAGIAAVGVLLLLTRYELRWLTKVIFIIASVVTLAVGILANKFLNGELKDVSLPLAILPNSWLNADYKGIEIGPLPRGTPVNLIMNMDPAKIDKVVPALVALVRASAQIKKEHLTGDKAYAVIAKKAGAALIAASKCPEFVLDRGHYFGDVLNADPAKNEEEKEALIAFLKTL